MASKESLTASLEDYLEAVFQIKRQKGKVRATDIARRMGVKAPSVTGALRALGEKGLVNYAPYDQITLTPRGSQVARDVAERHGALKDFLVEILCVDPAEAEDSACRMEHALSPEILSRLRGFLHFLENCPLGGRKWIRRFAAFYEDGEFGKHCEDCLDESRKALDEKQEN